MKRRYRDPYIRVLENFNQKGIRYVVVGMAGINYYARNAAEMFATMDYDLFLEPSLSNVEKTIQSPKTLRFTLATQKRQFKQIDLKKIVRERRTLIATTEDGILVELLLKISGYPFSELAKDAATFTVDGIPIKVGRLTKLLLSKRLANRPKDRLFLKRYKVSLEDE